MSEFWIKYALRVAHIGSILGLCHKTFTDFQAGSIAADNALFYTVLGVVAIASGMPMPIFHRLHQHLHPETVENGREEETMGRIPSPEARHHIVAVLAIWEMDDVGGYAGQFENVLGLVHNRRVTLYEVLQGSQFGQIADLIDRNNLVIISMDGGGNQRKLFASILEKTRNNYLKQPDTGSQKISDKVVDKLLSNLAKISQSLRMNSNKASKFCLQQIEKSKLPVEQQYYFSLQAIQIPSQIEGSSSYFIRQKSPKYPLQYTYLKCSPYLYIFNHAFIPKSQLQLNITYILSQSRMSNIFTYVQLCVHYHRLFRIITTVTLWRKVMDVLEIFFGKAVLQLSQAGSVMLFQEEKAGSFDFQNSIMIFNRNLWHWDSFNVFIIIKGVKYLIKGPGIDNEQAVYVAWRKDFIDESEYCRLIDKQLKTGITWDSSHGQLSPIKQKCSHFITSLMKYFNNFSNCELFTQIDQQIIKEIYLCGQIVSYIQNQVLYKALTILDRFFIILEGQVQVQSEGVNQNTRKGVHGYFFLSSLLEQQPTIRCTLKICSKQATIFSIPLWKLNYILSTNVQSLQQIHSQPIQSLQLSQKWQQLNLSQWMLKTIQYNQAKSRNLSKHTTKCMGSERTKVSMPLWRILCGRDLRVLYLTHEDIDGEQI